MRVCRAGQGQIRWQNKEVIRRRIEEDCGRRINTPLWFLSKHKVKNGWLRTYGKNEG